MPLRPGWVPDPTPPLPPREVGVGTPPPVFAAGDDPVGMLALGATGAPGVPLPGEPKPCPCRDRGEESQAANAKSVAAMQTDFMIVISKSFLRLVLPVTNRTPGSSMTNAAPRRRASSPVPLAGRDYAALAIPRST